MSENYFTSIINAAMEKAAERRNGLAEYVGEDGIRRCDVCGEPLEAELPEEIKALFPNKKTRPRMCRCDRERANMEETKEQDRQKQYRIEALKGEGLYSRMYASCTFENDDLREEKAGKVARNFVENFDFATENNMGILFWGGVGTGKTYYAACIANALIEKCKTVVMSNVQTLVAEMTENFNANREHVLNTVKTCDLLILDDLGAERGSDFMQDNVYSIVDARCRSCKPMIVTTNLNPADFRKEEIDIKRRTYDRISECCTPVLVNGESRRMGIAKEKALLFKKMLGIGENE